MPPPLLRGKPGPILKYVLGQNDSSSTSGDISRRSTRLNTCFRTCHPCTTESPSAAGIHPHGARRCGETSGCFPLCSSLAPGRRTAPESCRLPSPAPTPLPDDPAGSRSPTPGERGPQILLLDGSLLLSSFLSQLDLLPVHTRVPVDTNKQVCPYKHFDLHQSSTALQGQDGRLHL